MNLATPPGHVFKECPSCWFTWECRDDFLSDPEVTIIGYQAHFSELTAGFFLFNHSCQGTFAVRVQEFRDLYDGPIFERPKTGTDECPGYCLNKDELRSCPALCECAFVREIIQVIAKWPRNPRVLV
jgi:hypothetical protein